MHAKTRGGTRFFAHAPNAPNCALALETLAHHLLKLELLKAAQDAGADAEMEVRGPGGTWRADVMASDHGGTWRMALEAQLAAITDAGIIARTERMSADGVRSIWFSDRPQPAWLGVVPSVRLARPDDGQGPVMATGPARLRRYDCDCGAAACREYHFYWEEVPATLVQFLGWVFTGRIRPYGCHWTTPPYIAEAEAEAERQERVNAALIRAQASDMAPGLAHSQGISLRDATERLIKALGGDR